MGVDLTAHAELGREALQPFGVEPVAELELLEHAENTVFGVEADDGRYVLRVHRPDYQSRGTIASELRWLAALRASGVGVPEPLSPGVVSVSTPALGSRCCVVFRWIDGEFAEPHAPTNYYESVGALMGRLHAHALEWTRPAGFAREAWDAGALVGARARFGKPEDTVSAGTPEHEQLHRIRRAVYEGLSEYGRGLQQWALVHADLHRGNVLVREGTLHVIDFDDCGESWLLYDVAVCVSPFHRRFAETLAALERGYETIRPFPPDAQQMLPVLHVARQLTMLAWLGSRSDVERLRDLIPSRARIACELGECLLSGGSLRDLHERALELDSEIA